MKLELKQTLFYRHEGSYYVVKGETLAMIDGDCYLEYQPGNAVYNYLINILNHKEPISKSKADEIRRKLKERIDDLE